MNILQIEDDIKSLPDSALMQSMQTGAYPQYLVISELKRRKDMREDHAGRMASYNKDNTVADRIVNEANMGMMNQGLGGMTPAPMMNMQGMPQNTPMMPVGDQGIGQMMPSNMVGMKEGKDLPNKGLEALAKVAPEVVENMGYSGGGIVEMAPGQQVPFNFYNPTGVGEFYDFYAERMQPTQAELDYQSLMRGYFDPEEQEKRRRSRQGLDLVRAGLAVGTSATPQQLQQSLNPVIEGAAKTLAAADKDALTQAKMEADIAKTDRARETKIAELAYKSEQAKKLGDYYERMGSKPQANEALAQALARDIPDMYGTPIRNEKGTITGYKPNQQAYNKSGELIGYGTITRGEQAADVDLKEELNEAVTGRIETVEHERFVDRAKQGLEPGYEGLNETQIREKRRAEYIAEEAKKLGISMQYSGGQIPALPEDPPMIDMSSRF
tara:strand:+ start:297 stop:1616 length:1320 start_codon:yes stop_codon:yes gene_type:complete